MARHFNIKAAREEANKVVSGRRLDHEVTTFFLEE
jgi:hypothetical protein